MKPESISERLMFNTVRLVTDTGCGTGSFFNFKIGDSVVPVIITNKHVVNNNPHQKTTFFLHTRGTDDNPDDNIQIDLETDWIFHEDKDICYCYINPIIKKIKEISGKAVYYVFNDESIIPTSEQLKDLSALEELVMVGYPIGLWDEKNNLPIFRKGFTACHPAIDFNVDGIGLVDMACFPGSSGSPIYILNENGYKDKKGNMFIGRSRILLLGYLFAGPLYSANGNIAIQNIPTKQNLITTTPVMANLGYYIKSSEILDFKKQIEKDIQKSTS